MSTHERAVYLDPESEAKRLWQGAQEALRGATDDFARLSEAIDLGVRVVEILMTRCLQPLANEFPATITGLLESPPPEVDPQRDLLNPPKSLRFLDALDMLSASDLACVSPNLHHGWEDRLVSCQRSRARAHRATGISITCEQREALMVIGAYRNRIFLLPPPVRIVPQELFDAFPGLTNLVEQLFAACATDDT